MEAIEETPRTDLRDRGLLLTPAYRFPLVAFLFARLAAQDPVVVSRLQAPQVLSGPNNRADMNHVAAMLGDEIVMYLSNSYTYHTRGKSMRAVVEQTDYYLDPNASLVPGGPEDFDNNGAWMIHIEQDPDDPGLVRGWYHAEDRDGGSWHIKSLAYCESRDGGRTFQKVCLEDPERNHPNNQFITHWTGYDGSDIEMQTGDGRIAKIGDYYYCYFIETGGGPWDAHVARSHVDDRGRPGTWLKYYDATDDGVANGDFTEPGLGGRSSSPFPADGTLWGRDLRWNEELGRFMVNAAYYRTGFSGLHLGFSRHMVNGWRLAPYPFVPFEGDWMTRPSFDRSGAAKELHAYPGFATLRGDTQGDDSGGRTEDPRASYGTDFWYVVNGYLNPHEGFGERYSLRQRMTLSVTTSSAARDRVGRIELALFRHHDDSDDWATTYCTFGHYRKLETLGYVCTAHIPSTVPLFGLYEGGTGNHFLSLHPDGADKLRLLGYVFTSRRPGTAPLYRTWAPSGTNHSASTDPDHPAIERFLGYIFPAVGDETFAFRHDAMELTERIDGGAEGKPLRRVGAQGYFNWYFQERRDRDGSLADLVYSPSGGSIWRPNEVQVWVERDGGSAMLNAVGGQPGEDSRAVRKWIAIDTGMVFIAAKAFDRDERGGDGVSVMVQKNGERMWSAEVANGQGREEAARCSLWTATERGDEITFEIDARSDVTFDNTYFRPTVWFQSAPPGLDTDGDDLSDLDEVRDLDPATAGVQNPFDPDLEDSTGDEGRVGSDGVPDGGNDWDGDGICNLAEILQQTNPYDAADLGAVELDCNDNGIHDACDIAGGVVHDTNQNGFPDECESHFLRGDCNDDGNVDLSDAVCILSWLFLRATEPGCVAATNANGDAGADLSDAVYLLGHLFLGGPAPVEPFPNCGTGTPEDYEELACDTPPVNCQSH